MIEFNRGRRSAWPSINLSFAIPRHVAAFLGAIFGFRSVQPSPRLARGTPCRFGRAASGAARAKRLAAKRNNLRKHPRGAR